MIVTTANCPSCGGPITFKVGSSIAVICEFCGSVVARTDRDLRNLGKVADLVDTQSPLRVGLEGRFDGQPFVLTGRVQIAHQAGGVWDEWYASFPNGAWGWLAESQGRFHMTFFRQSPNPAAIPPPNVLGPGARVALPGDQTPWVVGETGVGRIVSGQGEIPYAPQPGLTYAYADLSGPGGAFATIDYRQPPPVVFAGREVTLKEMGISAVVDEFDAEQKRVKVEKLACPQCAGPLELRAPDASLRVTCPNCNALLDVNHGNLSYLRTLEQGRQQRFPNGSVAVIDGVEMTLIGFMVRGCQVEGEWFYWEEYLLYSPAIGFRWVVNGEGGWFFVEPISPGDVQVGAMFVRFQGKRFHHKETVQAIVNYVRGEFYWRVQVGEPAQTSDYVSGNETLSQEISENEVNWSFGRRIDPTMLERAFAARPGPGRVELPPPRVYVPPKPLPSMWTALGIWLLLSVLAYAVGLGIAMTAERRQVIQQTAAFGTETVPPRPPQPSPPDSESEVSWTPAAVPQTVVLGSFQLTGKKNLQVDVTADKPVYGSLYLKLVNDATGEVRNESFSTSGSVSRVFDNPGPGQYTLYAIRQWTEGDPELTVTAKVTEDVAVTDWPFFVTFLLGIGPALLLVMKMIRAATRE